MELSVVLAIVVGFVLTVILGRFVWRD